MNNSTDTEAHKVSGLYSSTTRFWLGVVIIPVAIALISTLGHVVEPELRASLGLKDKSQASDQINTRSTSPISPVLSPQPENHDGVAKAKADVTELWHQGKYDSALHLLDSHIKSEPESIEYRTLYHTIAALWYEQEKGNIPLSYQEEWLRHLNKLKTLEVSGNYRPDAKESRLLQNMREHLETRQKGG